MCTVFYSYNVHTFSTKDQNLTLFISTAMLQYFMALHFTLLDDFKNSIMFIYNRCSLLNQNYFSEADHNAFSSSPSFSLLKWDHFIIKLLKPCNCINCFISLSPNISKAFRMSHCFHSMKLIGDSNSCYNQVHLCIRVSVYTQKCT